MRKLTTILILVICFSSFAKAQQKVDSIVRTLQNVPDKYARQADSVINGLKEKPVQVLHKGDSLLKTAQATTAKYLKKVDSSVEALQKIPVKYLKQVETKIDKYSDRLTGKTLKTLQKLAKWETKIKILLHKASPETEAKLFANETLTFNSLLQKIKDGEDAFKNYKAQYNEYRDKLVTNIKYLESQKDNLASKVVKPLSDVSQKTAQLEGTVSKTEAIQNFIKERKKQLIDESIRYIGKSKYLSKIDKEAYYYVETLKNYKEIFSDSKKAEETAKKILNKIPAVKQFFQQNSMLASLFGNSVDNSNPASLEGLQTRSSVNALIQNRIASGGPNAKELLSQNLQQAQAELTKLKDKLLKAGVGSSSQEIPNFKPNMQKTKTFIQRLETGFNYQFSKDNDFLPTTADIGLTIGYKLNDKSIVGIGVAYKVGLGTIDKIKITHRGIGFRSFIDWKLKKQFFISGGVEMNYNASFGSISQLQKYNKWQTAGLVGLSKKFSFKTKLAKGTKVQILYDAFYRQHIPTTKPFVFRIGYTF